MKIKIQDSAPLPTPLICAESLSVREWIEHSECQPHQPAAHSESKLRRAEHILCQKAKNGFMDFVPWLHFVFKCQDIPVEGFRVTVLWDVLAWHSEGALTYSESSRETFALHHNVDFPLGAMKFSPKSAQIVKLKNESY